MNTLSDIGERKAIELIKTIIPSDDLVVSLIDDCGVVDLDDSYILVTTDMMSKQTHIPPNMTPWQIGWFIVAINLSDIAAKGGTPTGFVLSLGLPKEYGVRDFKKLIQGAKHCLQTFQCPLIGGDTKENQSITLCGTAIGMVSKTDFMSRIGARPGDLVAVTGTLGKAGAGYYSIHHHLDKQEMKQALLEPTPRINAGRLLASTKKVHCCMDLSDGLSSSLYQLGTLNDVGFLIEENQLPKSAFLNTIKTLDPSFSVLDTVLHFGGDYELLLTCSPKDYSLLEDVIQPLSLSLNAIGQVTESKDIYLKHKKGSTILPDEGYEHFT